MAARLTSKDLINFYRLPYTRGELVFKFMAAASEQESQAAEAEVRIDCESESPLVSEEEADDDAGTSLNLALSAPTPKKAKAKAKAGKAGKGAGGGRPSKVQEGKKWCRAHQKYHAVEEFPAASASCRDGKRYIQNIQQAAICAGKEDWWKETFNDDMKLTEAIRFYEENCAVRLPGTKKKNPKVFPIMQYLEVKKESNAWIHDDVMEPMDLLQFTAWKAKPKNGSMDGMAAIREFDEACLDKQKFLDLNGKHPLRKERILVCTKEQFLKRNKSSSSRLLQTSDKQFKNVSQEQAALVRDEFARGGQKFHKDDFGGDGGGDQMNFIRAAEQASGGLLSSEAKAVLNLDMNEMVRVSNISDQEKRKREDTPAKSDDEDNADVAASSVATASTTKKDQKRILERRRLFRYSNKDTRCTVATCDLRQ